MKFLGKKKKLEKIRRTSLMNPKEGYFHFFYMMCKGRLQINEKIYVANL
jgi:hypothetical protein